MRASKQGGRGRIRREREREREVERSRERESVCVCVRAHVCVRVRFVSTLVIHTQAAAFCDLRTSSKRVSTSVVCATWIGSQPALSGIVGSVNNMAAWVCETSVCGRQVLVRHAHEIVVAKPVRPMVVCLTCTLLEEGEGASCISSTHGSVQWRLTRAAERAGTGTNKETCTHAHAAAAISQ